VVCVKSDIGDNGLRRVLWPIMRGAYASIRVDDDRSQTRAQRLDIRAHGVVEF
jgi:hypothetical protein